MTTAGRLSGRRTFAALAKHGRTVRSGPLRVRYLPAPGDGLCVGYAIGKATGPAVVRNRIRRRLRAAIATSKIPLTSGFCLVSADTRAAGLPFGQLVSAFESAASDIHSRVTS